MMMLIRHEDFSCHHSATWIILHAPAPVIETATKSIIWGGGTSERRKTHIYAHTVGPRKSKYIVLRFSAGVMTDDYNATFV